MDKFTVQAAPKVFKQTKLVTIFLKEVLFSREESVAL